MRVDTVEVVRIDRKTAAEWVGKKHYRRTLGIFWEAFALVEYGMITGVVCYGQPSAPIQKHAFKDRDFRLYELTRLVTQTGNKNAASVLISRSLRMLKSQPCAVISYADGAMGHYGIVYQATNWTYTGAVKAHDKFYRVGGELLHPMTVKDRYGVTNPTAWAKANNVEMVQPEPKHRYFQFVGSKKQRAAMFRKLNYAVVPEYPKGDQSRYDDGPYIIMQA